MSHLTLIQQNVLNVFCIEYKVPNIRKRHKINVIGRQTAGIGKEGKNNVRLTKHLLREAARRVLELGGEEVRLKAGPGIVPGARLQVLENGRPVRTISVRTSLDREVGLMRNEKGDWRTIRNVNEVLVAAPSEDGATIEVTSFKPEVLIEAFNDAIDKRPKLKRDHRLPLFIPLDDKRGKRIGATLKGLKANSSWQKTITPDEEMLRKGAEKFSQRSFVERVKREFAELNGVEVSKVAVEFRIVA